jgi:hypothetical protein
MINGVKGLAKRVWQADFQAYDSGATMACPSFVEERDKK